jgi:hypothetical protein
MPAWLRLREDQRGVACPLGFGELVEDEAGVDGFADVRVRDVVVFGPAVLSAFEHRLGELMQDRQAEWIKQLAIPDVTEALELLIEGSGRFGARLCRQVDDESFRSRYQPAFCLS